MKRSLGKATVLSLALALVVTACGETGETTTTASAAGESTTSEGDLAAQPTTVAEVLEAVSGLEGDERRARLIELASAEEGPISWYASVPADIVDDFVEVFREDTGLSVEVFRSSAPELLQRILEEQSAGRVGADVVESNFQSMVIKSQEGLLAPIETPASEGIPDDINYGDWIATFVTAYAPSWNTDLVDDPPTTWVEVLTNFSGQLAMENSDFDWFAQIINHLIEDEGMTQEDAVQFMKDAAAGAMVVDGHTLLANLLAAGQFAVGTSPYQDRIESLGQEGAPVDWQPPIEPMFAITAGAGVLAEAEHPAGGVLFLEWRLDEGMIRGFDDWRLAPSNPSLGGLLAEYGDILRFTGRDIAVDDRDYWVDLYEEVLRNAAGVVEDEG